MEDCQEWSECGAAVSPSPGGAALTRPTVGGSCWPGKANPPPGTLQGSLHIKRPVHIALPLVLLLNQFRPKGMILKPVFR